MHRKTIRKAYPEVLEGCSIEEAQDNLRGALRLFFETATSEEITQRLHNDIFVTSVEVNVW